MSHYSEAEHIILRIDRAVNDLDQAGKAPEEGFDVFTANANREIHIALVHALLAVAKNLPWAWPEAKEKAQEDADEDAVTQAKEKGDSISLWTHWLVDSLFNVAGVDRKSLPKADDVAIRSTVVTYLRNVHGPDVTEPPTVEAWHPHDDGPVDALCDVIKQSGSSEPLAFVTEYAFRYPNGEIHSKNSQLASTLSSLRYAVVEAERFNAEAPALVERQVVTNYLGWIPANIGGTLVEVASEHGITWPTPKAEK